MSIHPSANRLAPPDSPVPATAMHASDGGLVADLLTRCGRGDEAALALLLETFYPVAVAAAAGRVAPPDIDRVVEVAFLTIWRDAPLYESAGLSAVTWTMRHIFAATGQGVGAVSAAT